MRTNQSGIAHILLMIVLLAGLAFGVYLVQQKTNLFSRAGCGISCPISGPITPTVTPGPAIPQSTIYRRVFVTSNSTNGDLKSAGSKFGLGNATSGLDGADKICQGTANIVDLGGDWKAWISDATSSASVRLEQASVPYKLLDGTTIANDWNDLTDGSLQSDIYLSEYRTEVADRGVWTNTTPNGSIDQVNPGNNCGGWSSNSLLLGGNGGNTTYHPWSIFGQGTTWTHRYGTLCGSPSAGSNQSSGTPFHLYCFEQGASTPPTPSQGGPVIDLPGPLPDIPIPPIFNPVPGPEPTTPPPPEPTPTLAPGSNNWGTDTQVVCSNGSTPQKRERTRLVYTIWPDEPYDLNNPVKFRKGEFSYDDPEVQIISITNNLSVSSGYVGVETESGQFLVPTGKPQDDDLEYGKFFGINMVRWYKNDLPRGYYNIPFEAPSSWCQ